MSSQPTEPRCVRCRSPLMFGARFCSWCGQPVDNEPHPPTENAVQLTTFNNVLAALLVIATAFAVVYRVNESQGLMQTYATFVGLPLLIGLLTAYLTRPKSGLGMTLKVTTIILCVVCPLLGEGAVCILMAAPIFYAIAAVGYLIAYSVYTWLGQRWRNGAMVIVLLPFLAAKLTSTPHSIRNPRTMTVQNEVFIAAAPEIVWDVLLHGDLVSSDFPLLLRAGFPLPKKLERRADGSTRLTFDPGSEPWHGTNVIVSQQVADAAHHRLTFVIKEDGTKLARWLTFRRTRFEVEPCEGGCRLRQTTTFRQRMQPGLYWNALQRFFVGQMHGYALSHIKRLSENRIRE